MPSASDAASEPTGPISTYELVDSDRRVTVGLCARHDCTWMRELQQNGDLDDEDANLLTRDFVLNHTGARII